MMKMTVCGKTNETNDAKLVSLKSVFELDNSIGALVDILCGYYTTREKQEDN